MARRSVEAKRFIDSEANVLEVANLLDEAFKDEPVSPSLLHEPMWIRDTVCELLPLPLNTALSTVAIDSSNGKTVGAILVTDLSTEATSVTAKRIEGTPLADALGDLEKFALKYFVCASDGSVPAGLVAHLHLGGVVPSYRGSGALSKAIDLALELCNDRNYKFVLAHPTSAFSARAFFNRGFSKIASIEYDRWVDSRGNRHVSHLPDSSPHKEMCIVGLKLSSFVSNT
jgi:hypothetical protein